MQRQIFSNLRSVLETAGTSLDNVVKCNIFLTSMQDFGAVNEVYASVFAQPMPVSLGPYSDVSVVQIRMCR